MGSVVIQLYTSECTPSIDWALGVTSVADPIPMHMQKTLHLLFYLWWNTRWRFTFWYTQLLCKFGLVRDVMFAVRHA